MTVPDLHLRLYGAKGSWCTLRVIATLNEVGLKPGRDYELIEIDMGKGEHKSTAHKKLQPLGKIPVLEVDGLVLYGESSLES
jgi:glutathione S-transferase